MNRRLWTQPSFKPIEQKRYTWVAVWVGGTTAMVGAGVSLYEGAQNREAMENQGGSGGGTYTIDPAKKRISDLMSEYLATRVGQPGPQYPGSVTTELDPMAKSRYADFMGMDAGEWFNKNVTAPTMRDFSTKVLPEINESWAGMQSGSGRGWDQTQAASEMSYQLGVAGGKAIPAIQESQVGSGFKMAALNQDNAAREYDTWLKEQPEYSPVLQQALTYLGAGTQTGTGWQDPNQVTASNVPNNTLANTWNAFDSKMDWQSIINGLDGKTNTSAALNSWYDNNRYNTFASSLY